MEIHIVPIYEYVVFNNDEEFRMLRYKQVFSYYTKHLIKGKGVFGSQEANAISVHSETCSGQTKLLLRQRALGFTMAIRVDCSLKTREFRAF